MFLAPAVLLALFLYPGTATASANSPGSPGTVSFESIHPGLSAETVPVASAANSATPPAAGIRFDNIHLGLAANPPAPCTAPFYGTLTARAPDGALCLCHQSYDGKQSFWEQLGTGKACWPDKK